MDVCRIPGSGEGGGSGAPRARTLAPKIDVSWAKYIDKRMTERRVPRPEAIADLCKIMPGKPDVQALCREVEDLCDQIKKDWKRRGLLANQTRWDGVKGLDDFEEQMVAFVCQHFGEHSHLQSVA